MTLNDLLSCFYRGRKIELVECIRDHKQQREIKLSIVEGEHLQRHFTFHQLYRSEVVMFQAIGKDSLKVWTDREVGEE